MMRSLAASLLMTAALACGPPEPALAPSGAAAGPAGSVRLAEDGVLVPLQVVLIHADSWLPAGTSPGFDANLPQVLDDLNAIFAPAHIRFALGSVTVLELPFTAKEGERPSAARVIEALPPVADPHEGLRLYYAGTLDVNGIAVGTRAALVQERSRLIRVAGGVDDAVARVTGHMLGALLGLDAVGDQGNLMGLGTSGASLDEKQVNALRAGAARLLTAKAP